LILLVKSPRRGNSEGEPSHMNKRDAIKQEKGKYLL